MDFKDLAEVERFDELFADYQRARAVRHVHGVAAGCVWLLGHRQAQGGSDARGQGTAGGALGPGAMAEASPGTEADALSTLEGGAELLVGAGGRAAGPRDAGAAVLEEMAA